MSSNPYVNIVDGKLERLYLCDFSGNGRVEVMYRPTHELIGIYDLEKASVIWKSSVEQFYRVITRRKWFRIPHNGIFDMMYGGHYDDAEKRYEMMYLPFTEQFIESNGLPRLYEDIPYDFISELRMERMGRDGRFLSAEFDEYGHTYLHGEYSAWINLLFDAILEFRGSTQLELFRYVEPFIDPETFAVMIDKLKENGVRGISDLKRMTRKQLTKALISEINTWK